MIESPTTFLELAPPYCDYATARFALLPVPYDGTVTFQSGTKNGPAAILNASAHLETLDEELGAEFHQAGIAVADAVAVGGGDPRTVHVATYTAARKIVADGKFLIGLGGEHGISSALVRAVAEAHAPLSVLQIDAHCDLYDAYLGEKYSHASVMRRIVETGASIVPVGIRCVAPEEHRFIQDHKIDPIMAADCLRSDAWISKAVARLGSKVYVTIDIDGFDPAYAPGTGTPVPGGLDWYGVTRLLRCVAASKQIVGADIVEVMPLPGQAATEFLAAKLAYRLLAYVQAAEADALTPPALAL